MDFEPHNFPALVASVVRTQPMLAEHLKDIFAAYARNEALEERLGLMDHKFHHTLRIILADLNDIDDPEALDLEIKALHNAIDAAVLENPSHMETNPASKKRKSSKKKNPARVAAKKKVTKKTKTKTVPGKKKMKKKGKPVVKATSIKKKSQKKTPVKSKNLMPTKKSTNKATKKAKTNKATKKAKTNKATKKAKTKKKAVKVNKSSAKRKSKAKT